MNNAINEYIKTKAKLKLIQEELANNRHILIEKIIDNSAFNLLVLNETRIKQYYNRSN